MMAPQAERARLLYAAIDKASFGLKRSIDRLELVGNQILFRAGAKRLTVTYRYVDNVMPGPGAFQLDGAFYERPETPKGTPPWYMRSILLYAAIRQATYGLGEPVDGAKVKAGFFETVAAALPVTIRGSVTCWAADKRQTLHYRYVAEHGPLGSRRLFLDGEEIGV
jgi:hypothetical protein